MKIIFDNGGQTCNKFWSYIPVLYDCINNNNNRAYILSYISELDDYPLLKKNPYLRYPLYCSLFNKLLGSRYPKYISKLFRNKMWNMVTPLCKLIPTLFVDSWNYIDDEIDQEYLNEIKRYFIPNEIIQNKVKNVFSKYKHSDTLIVGVHIRRGDYDKWLNGKYFYELNDYAACCRAIETTLKRKVVFLLCSNEQINYSWFKGLDVFQINETSPSLDLYALSICDYIIGPPSTFSTWASFLGNKPHSFIYNVNNFTPKFRIIKSHALYDTGEKIEYNPYDKSN